MKGICVSVIFVKVRVVLDLGFRQGKIKVCLPVHGTYLFGNFVGPNQVKIEETLTV